MRLGEKLAFLGLIGVSIWGIAYAGKRLFGEMTQEEAEVSKKIMDTVNDTGKLFINDKETRDTGDVVTEMTKMGFDYMKK